MSTGTFRSLEGSIATLTPPGGTRRPDTATGTISRTPSMGVPVLPDPREAWRPREAVETMTRERIRAIMVPGLDYDRYRSRFQVNSVLHDLAQRAANLLEGEPADEATRAAEGLRLAVERASPTFPSEPTARDAIVKKLERVVEAAQKKPSEAVFLIGQFSSAVGTLVKAYTDPRTSSLNRP